MQRQRLVLYTKSARGEIRRKEGEEVAFVPLLGRHGWKAERLVSAKRESVCVYAGTVQGVGFRWFTRGAARELGVAGRVRNLRDGSVEIEAAGEPEALDRLQGAGAAGAGRRPG